MSTCIPTSWWLTTFLLRFKSKDLSLDLSLRFEIVDFRIEMEPRNRYLAFGGRLIDDLQEKEGVENENGKKDNHQMKAQLGR